MQPARSIDEVIVRLDEIIARARREQSRVGFFAALYRNVTLKVKEGIHTGLFEDGPRVERLDVAFANRYLAAHDAFVQGERPTRSWLVAFEATRSRWPIILQHLLLGINAHINLDLGVAAAEVAPGAQLPSLKNDFDAINGLLAGMLMRVMENVEELSPKIKWIDRLTDDRVEDALINFSLSRARAWAWASAVRLASATPPQVETEIARLDREVALLGKLVRRPVGVFVNLGLLQIRLRETNDVPHAIDVLSQV